MTSRKLSKRVEDLLTHSLCACLVNNLELATQVDILSESIPQQELTNIDQVIVDNRTSYREALLIQLAYGVCEPGIDLRIRHEGARGIAGKLSSLLKKSHIQATSDAFQNIGKNSVNLVRGNFLPFDDLLIWASSANIHEIDGALNYTVIRLAMESRPVLRLPEIVAAKLTFYRAVRIIEDLLNKPSGGAHEQFAVAACLEALIDEIGSGGIGGLRVETKKLTASDLSSKVAGDIQLKRGNRTEEIFEVSASNYVLKLEQAAAAIKSNDLQRVHVIAAVRLPVTDLSSPLATMDSDISVIDVKSFAHVTLAVMRKPARAAAFTRLYDLLERNQPDISLVNGYVELLRRHGIFE